MNSYVAMAKNVCMATGKIYENGELLLDKRLKDIPEEKTIVGYGFCPEVQAKLDEGFYVLVGVVESKSKDDTGQITPESAYRTGDVIYMKKEAFHNMFDAIEGKELKDMVFIGENLVKYLKEMYENLEDNA